MPDQKRFFRQLKKIVKRTGVHQRRLALKRSLRLHPESAHWDDFAFNSSNSSQTMNGLDEEYAKQYDSFQSDPSETQGVDVDDEFE